MVLKTSQNQGSFSEAQKLSWLLSATEPGLEQCVTEET